MCPLMSVPISGRSALRTGPGGLLVMAVLGVGPAAAEGLFQEVDADAFGAAGLVQRRGSPGFALDHLGEEGQPHRDDLAVVSEAGDRALEESSWAAVMLPAEPGSRPKAWPNFVSTFTAWLMVEQVDRREVMALDDRRLELAQEPRRGHREVVAHHDDRLDLAAVALAEGVHQLGVGLGPARVEPLLELVQHDQDLLAVGQRPPRRSSGTASASPRSSGRSGRCFRSPRSSRVSVSSAVAST